MRPPVPDALADLAARLRTDIVPELTGFRAGATAMTAQMIDMVAEEWDRAAERLVKENRRLRTILARGAEVTGDPAYSAAVIEDEDDFRLSALGRVNDAMREALTALHAAVETRGDPPAEMLNAAIWAELRQSVATRRVGLANF